MSDSDALAHKEKSDAARASLITALVLTIIKLVVGFYTNSLGILSEALHSGLDLLAAFMTLFAVRLAARPADERHAYGHGKAENLAALGETALLFITCGWIIGEGVERLFFNAAHVVPSMWGVAVMAVSIVLDAHRVRILRRVAKKHNSQALEADALHFSSDILSSAVVLLGLLVIWFAQYLPESSPWKPALNNADAIAALLVSLIVLHAGYTLARKAVHDLMDGGSEELRESVLRAVANVPGVSMVRGVRLRTSGPSAFVDLTLGVPARLTVEGGHRVAEQAEACIKALLPGSDVVIHVEPSNQEASDNPLTIMQNCAAERDISIHGLQVLETQDGVCAELHAEMPGQMSLREAHDRVTFFEEEVQSRLRDIRIVSHLEPLGSSPQDMFCLLPTAAEEVTALESVIKDVLERTGAASGCHRVTAYYAQGDAQDAALSVSFHCRMPGTSSVAEAHEKATQLERVLRKELPHLGRIVIHMEPEPGT